MNDASSRRARRIALAALATAGLAATATTGLGTSAAALSRPAGHAHGTAPIPAVADHVLAHTLAFPPDTAYCQQHLGINCYSPVQYQKAYDLAPLYGHGVTGKGRTIAIVDSFGSPTIADDLHVFDQNYGLPDPPSLQIIQPAGAVPPFNNTDSTQLGWATETTLDVEYAHAIAPGAKILLVETPVAETEGVTGFPEIVAAENYVIDHRLADVITQSFGATEETFPSKASLLSLRSAFKNAARHGVTVLASSGDTGVTNYNADGSALYPNPVNSWPSSDPLVTSIGGTQLHLDAAGNKVTPDSVWNDGYGAGGGGQSHVFARPDFQDSVRSVVGPARGTPDISMSAAVDGGAILYYSFDPNRIGWHIVGGTSEASPLFSGIVALAAQYGHHRLGTINEALYRLNRRHASGIVDVTSGDISFSGVTGPAATPGYDMASGVGTVDAARFVPQLAAAGEDGQ
ncbi:MAG TPA: S53 family peptidase [Jatrophihabitans sp.]|uniref:S53 family peptidase n=1 Tax=Jatrophihabitans sp. TaxID=1932789 RepID=UPI002E095879|nr:S53 family peptidase [Jatrophihabitans sp.]